MKHDFRSDSSSKHAKVFLEWLESSTTHALKRGFGDAEATKAAIFLYTNRAYEAGLPEDKIGSIFGKCIARAGYSGAEQEPALAWLETFAETAKQVHGAT